MTRTPIWFQSHWGHAMPIKLRHVWHCEIIKIVVYKWSFKIYNISLITRNIHMISISCYDLYNGHVEIRYRLHKLCRLNLISVGTHWPAIYEKCFYFLLQITYFTVCLLSLVMLILLSLVHIHQIVQCS